MFEGEIMKIYILLFVCIFLYGCQGRVHLIDLQKAEQFCKPYGGIHTLRVDSIFDALDKVYCVDRSRESYLTDIETNKEKS